MNAQLVTVPILDARLQELRTETRIALMSLESKLETKMESITAELVRWVFPAMLGNVALGMGAGAILNALKNL